MPDKPNDLGDKAPLIPARDDANKVLHEGRVLAYTRPGVCNSCHSHSEPGADLKLLDFPKLNYGSFHTEPIDFTPEGLAKRLSELPRAKSEAENFREADPITKTSTVISRLPDFKISFADKKLSLETDFTKLLEATPGADLGPQVKSICGAARRISLDGDKFTMEMNEVAKLKIDRDVPLVGKITELRVGNAEKQFKFEVEFDPKNTERVSIKSISGMSLERQGADPLVIHEISLDTSGEKPMLKVTVDNPARWAKDITKTVTVPIDLAAAVPGLNADFLKGMVKTLSDSKSALQSRDAGMLLSGLPDEGIRNKLVDVLKGLTSIEKKGNELTLVRDNGVSEHDFGGPRLRVSPVIRCQIDTTSGGIDVSKMDGISLVTALPKLPDRISLGSGLSVLTAVPDLLAQVGFGSELSVGITAVSLGPKYGPKDNQSRALTIKSDSMVDSVRVDLTAGELKPKVDANGHWRLDISMTNSTNRKLLVPLKFDQNRALSNSNGEIAMIAADALQWAAQSTLQKAADTVDSAVTKVGSSAVRLLDGADTQVLKLGARAIDTARIGRQVMGSEVRDIYKYFAK